MKLLFTLLVLLPTFLALDAFSDSPKPDTPKQLYKVISMEDWKKVKDGMTEDYLPSLVGDTAFIHLSTEEQLPRIMKKFYKGQSQVIVLTLSTEVLNGDLRFEVNPGGENKYYHLYQAHLPTAAIEGVEVIDLGK